MSKEFKFQFRKSFEVLIHGTIEAKSQKDADKRLRKYAKHCYPEDNNLEDGDTNCDYTALDEGDDFSIVEKDADT